MLTMTLPSLNTLSKFSPIVTDRRQLLKKLTSIRCEGLVAFASHEPLIVEFAGTVIESVEVCQIINIILLKGFAVHFFTEEYKAF